MRLRPALAALAMLAACLLAPRPLRAAEDDEAALRRRVQRFYVLSYLNRHGEMWELFTRELQSRMGGDKREYISSARGTGFELYSSRIERVELREGGAAVVDVALQVKMPGSLQAGWRRHRMAWRLSPEDGWRYAGSLDITHEERDVAGQALGPPQAAGTAEGDAEGELLPRRERLTPAPKAPSVPPSIEPAASAGQDLEGNRWDLVALPPDGTTRPAPASAAAPAGASAPAPAPAASVTAPAGATAPVAAVPAPAVAAAASAPQWLPPDRAAVAAEPVPEPAPQPASEPGTASAPGTAPASAPDSKDGKQQKTAAPRADPDDPGGSLDEIVRRAAEASGMSRLRALDKLRTSSDPRLAALAAQALPKAPPGSQVVLLERLSVLGGSQHAPAALALISSDVADVRAAALAALAELGSEADAPRVLKVLQAEESGAARAAGFRALGMLGGGGPEGAALVAKTIPDTSEKDSVRAAAADAAGRARIVEAEPALVRVMSQARPLPVFTEAVASAGLLGTPAMLQALELLAAEGGFVEDLQVRLPIRLLALRALCAAEVEGAGLRMAREMLLLGSDVSATDVEIVAQSGETMALAELLAHPQVLVRVRSADLLGRAVEDAATAAAAMPFVDRALAEDHDPRVLASLNRTRARLVELTAAP